jgi:hypothetical protein
VPITTNLQPVTLARAPDGTLRPTPATPPPMGTPSIVEPPAPVTVEPNPPGMPTVTPGPPKPPAPTYIVVPHADGTFWVLNTQTRAEYGPCASQKDANDQLTAILRRNANEAAWTNDAPQTPWPADDIVAAKFDALWSSGPDGEPRPYTVGQMRAFYWAMYANPNWLQRDGHWAAVCWRYFAGSMVNYSAWVSYSDQNAPDAAYQKQTYLASLANQG